MTNKKPGLEQAHGPLVNMRKHYELRGSDRNHQLILRCAWCRKLSFFFALNSSPVPIETYIETSLQSDWDLWKNSRQPSKSNIRSLDDLFEDLVKEPLVQPQVNRKLRYWSIGVWWQFYITTLLWQFYITTLLFFPSNFIMSCTHVRPRAMMDHRYRPPRLWLILLKWNCESASRCPVGSQACTLPLDHGLLSENTD